MAPLFANMAAPEPVTAATLRAQVAELEKSLKFHRALGSWTLCNALEVDLANLRRALRRTEALEKREPVSGVHRRP